MKVDWKNQEITAHKRKTMWKNPNWNTQQTQPTSSYMDIANGRYIRSHQRRTLTDGCEKALDSR